jgi:hypothetical protein
MSDIYFQETAAISADLCFRKFLIKNPVRIRISSLVYEIIIPVRARE